MTRRKTATTASLPSEVTNVRNWRTREDRSAPFGNRCGSKSKRTLAWKPRHYLSGCRENILAGTRTGRFGPWSGESIRVAALTAICSRCLLCGPSELISH